MNGMALHFLYEALEPYKLNWKYSNRMHCYALNDESFNLGKKTWQCKKKIVAAMLRRMMKSDLI